MSKGRNYILFESTGFNLYVNKPRNIMTEQSERVVTLYNVLVF